MKLFFSTVLVAAPGGEILTYWESGHPDEYDICWTPITSWPAGTGAPGLSTGRMSARYEHSAFTWNYDGGIGRSRKCTLSHTQRHGRDFIRSSSIWARRAAGVPDC